MTDDQLTARLQQGPLVCAEGFLFELERRGYLTNRYEIGAFAKEAHELGVGYLGVCCGASPMLIREVAEAVGRTTVASRFSENMANHFMYGDNERLPEHIKALGVEA